MKHLAGSLRLRLALAGFVAAYLPVLLLLGVVFATTSVEVDTRPTERPPALDPGAVIEPSEPSSTRTATTSPWVWLTALGLAPATAAAAWWWAGRAVRPIARVQAGIDRIEGGDDLDTRIGIDRGPSELVALAASFDDMLERLQRAGELQRQLIEETSHELRTPLAVLTTNAEVLFRQQHPTLDGYRDGLERSRATAARLDALVDELLVDARGRARSIDRRPVDLAALARDAVAGLEALADDRDVRLEVRAAEPVEAAVDRPSVLRAVTNLVDNAVRHAPEGTEVEVEVAAAGDQARVTVTDRGPGVPADQQDAVFERFWRGDDAGPGTGLGLPICQQVARAHGGTVELASPVAEGAGARFVLVLPTG